LRAWLATLISSLSLAGEAALPGQDFNEAARGRRYFVASGGPTFQLPPRREKKPVILLAARSGAGAVSI
jgi:hypothetical protein